MSLLTYTAGENHYVYSAWSNRIARVSPALFQRLERFSKDPDDSGLKREAVSLGLLPPNGPNLLIHPPSRLDASLESLCRHGPRTLVLGMTEACNLRCRYCAYSGAYLNARTHSADSLSREHAMAALDWAASFSRKRLHVGFYGGEPLLRFSLMQRVVERAKALFPAPVALSFGLTTNGMLLSSRITSFLAEHEFDVFISLDGPEDVHDRYRMDGQGRPSFKRIWDTILSFRQEHGDYFDRHVGFNVTLAPPDRLRDIQSFFSRHPDLFGQRIINPSYLKDDPSIINSALGIDSLAARQDHAWIWDDFLKDCTEGRRPSPLIRALCQPAISRLHLRPMVEQNPILSTAGQCTPGERCHVDSQGGLHMCEHIDGHFPLGHVGSGFDMETIRRYLEDHAALVQPWCTGCWAARLCRRCIPMLADGPRLSRQRLARLCASTRRTLKESFSRYSMARDIRDDCFDFIADGRYDMISTPQHYSPEDFHGNQGPQG